MIVDCQGDRCIAGGSPWWLARTEIVKQPSAQGQRTASFDSNGVNWPWNGGSSCVEWKTYVRWMETKNQILLCSSPVQCAVVPKRALSPEQISELPLKFENGSCRWRKGTCLKSAYARASISRIMIQLE